MFRRLNTTTGVDGSGMGLALVRKLVTDRDGLVAIESDGRRGTTVRFTWPGSCVPASTTVVPSGPASMA